MNKKHFELDTLILAANKDLSWVKRIRVLNHIRRCEACGRFFMEHKKISRLFKELPEYQISDKAVKNIDMKTGVKSGEPSVLEDLLSIVFYNPAKYAVAVLIAVVLTGIILFRANLSDYDRSKSDQYYSASEINTANVKTKEALALLGKFLNKTQQQIGSEILRKKVSKPLNKGIYTITEIFNKEDKNEKQ